MRTSEWKRRVALIAEDMELRENLTTYLEHAGFRVDGYDELAVPSSFGALVLIDSDDSSERLLANVRSWMRLARPQRIVVVTSRPSALKELVLSHTERLAVLPAPAFGWDLVDALRAMDAPKPRGT